MARDDERLSADDRVRRARLVANAGLGVASAALLFAWAYFGVYQLEPGEAAVILQFGKYERTVSEPGLKWHLPPPLQAHRIVNVSRVEQEEFGAGVGVEDETGPARLEVAMQTKDNNIVNLGFAVQYRIKDPFFARYRIENPGDTLRDAAQAAIREVVGRTSIDGLLSEQRGAVERETEDVLQEILDRYESGLKIDFVQLQEVQPPTAVREAFDDVIASAQDENRAINEAEGYANEVLPGARAEAVELRAAAQAYRDATVAESTGEAQRFRALAVEYRRAPEVTRKRLYLETMESVLPAAEKVIIDPDAASILPYFPLGQPRDGSTR